MRLFQFALSFALLAGSLAAEDKGWPSELWDPGAEVYGPADLILPLPCGAAMAFQKVLVPVAFGDPLEDHRIRLGQSHSNAGFADYLFSTFLRGGFSGPENSGTAYFIGRYEVTTGQARALRGDCAAPERADRLAAGGLSWFDAVALAQRMTEWLMLNAPDRLPGTTEQLAFVRLPTEAEWEYATRGGARVSPASFSGQLFFTDTDGVLRDYALYADGRRTTPGPVGLRKPNPLGLFDVYGNAEELMLEPFRMNVMGRAHGQAGGLVTRGGALDSEAAQIYSARRTEYPFYNVRSGSALAGSYFGARFVLSTNVISDERFNAIQSSWAAMSTAPTEVARDGLAALDDILASEVDLNRQAALSEVQLQFRRARAETQSAQEKMAQSTLLSAGAFIRIMNSSEQELSGLRRLMNDLAIQYQRRRGDEREKIKESMRVTAGNFQSVQASLDSYALILRAALEALSVDIAQDDLAAAYDSLISELKAADQIYIIKQVLAANTLLAAYRAEPDMETGKLLSLVFAE